MNNSTVLSSTYSRDIDHAYKPMSAEEEIVCIKLAQAGDCRAQDKLVNSQLKCIVDIARGYACTKNPLEDLVGEGVKGLIGCIPDFDFSLGWRFNTYARQFIRNEITYMLYDNTIVRQPRNKAKQKEIAPKYDAEGNILDDGIERDRIASVSLSTPISDKDNSPTFESSLADDLNDTPEQASLRQDVKKLIGRAISSLSPTEQQIVKMWGGFDDKDNMSFQEIANAIGKSRQAVHIQYGSVLDKLKARVRHHI